jgi:hypothetical protein
MQRELSRLKGSGLVSAERIGNQEHYRANPDSPIFAELALAETLKEAMEPFSDQIDSAFIYGSVAKGTDTARRRKGFVRQQDKCPAQDFRWA